MSYNLRRSLNKNEYDAFKSFFLIFDIQKKDVINFDAKNIRITFNKQYRELSLKYHPDKNPDNKEAEQKFKLIASNKPFFEEFILKPLKEGLSKRNNLMRELRSKLWSYSDEELEGYLDDKYRNKLSNRKQSITNNTNNIKAYSKYSSDPNFLGYVLVLFTSIAFFIINGISCNIPIAVGFFASLLAPLILNCAIKSIYSKNENGKEFDRNTIRLLMFDFDEECQCFPENDRTKLKWLKNSLIFSKIICTSLMFCGVGLDLVANSFGVTNSILLSGLLLSLPLTLLVAASPVLDTESFKKATINLIEEQFRDGDKSIEAKPKSFVAAGCFATSCFSSRQLAITYP